MMKLISPLCKGGWITAIIDGRYILAQVLDTPSRFGIKGSRVCQLCILKPGVRFDNELDFSQEDYSNFVWSDYNYDFLPVGVLDSVISELETLPKVAEYAFWPESDNMISVSKI
jgi:hypothetical protein